MLFSLVGNEEGPVILTKAARINFDGTNQTLSLVFDTPRSAAAVCKTVQNILNKMPESELVAFFNAAPVVSIKAESPNTVIIF